MMQYSGLAKYKHRWVYNGIDEWDTIIDWCCLNCSMAGCRHDNKIIYFYFEDEYTMFLLRWG